MNWYKQAESNKVNKMLRRVMDDYHDDGVVIWTRGGDAFVSFGDWAESREECIADVQRVMGRGRVEWDYEIGSPGSGWIKV